MWDQITQQLVPLAIEFVKEWFKPVAFAAGGSLGIQLGLEWLMAPLFELPLLRRFRAAYQASRQLIAFGVSYWMFWRLHAEDVVRFGPGEAGWALVGLFALMGTAGAQVLHGVLKRRGLSNEAALEATRQAVDAAVSAVTAKLGRGAPPPAPPTGSAGA
jgi:hypothetical protein